MSDEMARDSYFVIAWIGIGIGVLGWVFFRRPGVSLWTVTPMWRTHHSLTPVGTVMSIGGWVILVVGFLLAMMYNQALINADLASQVQP
jgi:hypothetical protein